MVRIGFIGDSCPTNRVLVNLEFRELLGAIAANIREVMRCQVVLFSCLIKHPGSAG